MHDPRDIPGHVLIAWYLWDGLSYAARGDWLGFVWSACAALCVLWLLDFGRHTRTHRATVTT